MKLVAVLGLLVLVSSFQGADAQQRKTLPPVDFSAMTCDQFWAKTAPDDRGPFLFWLSGYFAHKSNSAVLDPVSFSPEDQGPVRLLRQAAQRHHPYGCREKLRKLAGKHLPSAPGNRFDRRLFMAAARLSALR